MKNLIVIITILIVRLDVFCFQPGLQQDWKHVARKHDIEVYARTVPGSPIKALKAECVLDADPVEVKKLIMDVSATVRWMCHAKRCELIRRISEHEILYYTEVSLPWPLDNRDFVTHAKLTEDARTGIVTISSPAVPGILPVYKGKVRVNSSESLWKLIPAAPGKLKVEYYLTVDPGGMIPAHVVNAFAVRAPIETFINMKKELKARRENLHR